MCVIMLDQCQVENGWEKKIQKKKEIVSSLFAEGVLFILCFGKMLLRIT